MIVLGGWQARSSFLKVDKEGAILNALDDPFRREQRQIIVRSRPVHTRRGFMKIDHHIHTSRYSPDSSIDPIKLVERASSVGLDAVVITEHDYQWQADELAVLGARAPALRVFSGAEISAREGHFLVYGPAVAKRCSAGYLPEGPDRSGSEP